MARRDSRETPLDGVCPNCQAKKHPLNLMCYKCHTAMSVAPQVGDGFQSKSTSTWVAKNTPTIATNGVHSTTTTEKASTNGNVPIVLATASGVKTNPSRSPSQQRSKLNEERRRQRVKGNRAGGQVQRGLVGDLQQARGEIDALREVARCTIEEAQEGAPSPLSAEDAEKATGAEDECEGPQLEIPKGLPRAIKDAIKRDIPGVTMVDGAVDVKPMLMKRLYEKYCVQMLAGDAESVVVIGRERVGDFAHRHHMHSTDDVGVEPDCTCAPSESCQHCDREMIILVDGIDKWEPVNIIALLLSEPTPRFYSVQYEYRAARGGLHCAPGCLPEVRWERTTDGLWVEDGQHMGKYVKSPADWTRTGAVVVGETTLCWNIVARVGDCCVAQYHLVDAKLAHYLEKDPMNDRFYGDTSPDQIGMGQARSVELQSIVGPIAKLYSAGDSFYCLVEDQHILVPKQGVAHIALWASGRPRESRTYLDAHTQARQWLKTSGLTTIEKADCVPYIVAFGLIRTMNAEARAISCLGHQSLSIARHNDLVSAPFAPPVPAAVQKWRDWYHRNQRWLLPLFAALSATAAAMSGVFNKGKVVHTLAAAHTLWTKFRPNTVAKAEMPLLSLLLWLVERLYAHYVGSRRTVVGPLHTFCGRGRKLAEMREGAKCVILNDDVPVGQADADNVDCHVTEGPYHVGLGVVGYVPVIARHCVHNDLIAVRNRGICHREPALPGWWNTVGRDKMFELFGNLGLITPTPRIEWLSRYSTSQRRRLDAALDWAGTDYHWVCTRKAFTKSECAVKRGDPTIDEPLGEINSYDPRLIQGCFPEYVNSTGPFAHALSKACKGEHGDTTYGPGMTAQQLDEWLRDAEDYFDEPVAYIDSDAVRLDASVPAECIHVQADLYEHLGADEEAVAMFHEDVRTHGATNNGVVYSVDGTVPSGKTTTTCGNTIAVITVVEKALEKVRHKAIVAGDDAAILVPARVAKEVRERLLSTGRSAGFEFKVKGSLLRYDMEFCSGRWWPAANNTGFAFGPKPGKLLPKLFFATNKAAFGSNPKGYCRAVCMGIDATVAHLPVAREFVEQVAHLSQDSRIPQGMRDKMDRLSLHNVRRKTPEVQSPDIWEAYAHIYGIGRHDCEMAVKAIGQIRDLPDMVEHSVFDAMVAQDAPPSGDPDERCPEVFAGANIFQTIAPYLKAAEPYMAFITPFFEERQRAKQPLVTTAALIGVESYSWYSAGKSLWGYLPAAVLHCVCCHLQRSGRFYTALGLHYGFNASVALYNWYYRTGERRLADGNLTKILFGASRPKSLTKQNCTLELAKEGYLAINMQQRKQQPRRQQSRPAQNKPAPVQRRPNPVPNRGPRRKPQAQQSLFSTNTNARAQMARNPKGMPRGLRPKKNWTPFSNDELITASVYGSTTFGASTTSGGAAGTSLQFTANPGIAATFPWLSKNAPQYEKYVFTQLEYYVKHKVSEFATAGSVGKVIMAFDYDAADAPFTSSQQMMDCDPHNDRMPCEDFAVRVDCAEAFDDGPKYVRVGNLPGGASIHDYDCGIINIAGDGNSDGTTKLVELHVRYSGYWIKPVLDSSAAASINYRSSWFQSTAAQAVNTGVATTQVVATATTNGLNIVNTSGSMVPPAGNYQVDFSSVVNDDTNEAFTALADFQKGGTSVYTATASRPRVLLFGGATGTAATLNGSVYVSANGTDAFTLVDTLTGAAGTLTAASSVRWVSV